jgi:hypothetical protein
MLGQIELARSTPTIKVLWKVPVPRKLGPKSHAESSV